MDLNGVLEELHYRGSPNFLVGDGLETDRAFGHIFRKARAECGLQGAYVLNGAAHEKSRGVIPVVYVCKAGSESEARNIHRSVWNQNAVPFLLVVSTAWVRLYPGFQYDCSPSDDGRPQGGLHVVEDFSQIAMGLRAISADAIDSGAVWDKLGDAVTPQTRVDWSLLANLRGLERWLLSNGVPRPRLAHSLIGKLVYLYYLRHRRILSDERLAEWNIGPGDVFGNDAKVAAFVELVKQVDVWLNGAVFPLSATDINDIGADALRKVVSVFHGEQATNAQLPLFGSYDFSFIPIETLSVVYEQFLHALPGSAGQSEGEARAAYYTPLPLVNFMLDRLDAALPLQPGMRVLDPSCGSGAFLVQCYRKLIERRNRAVGRKLSPAQLGELLTKHIFGVDIDEDACQIAELSLSLTLLDYVDPPDLTRTEDGWHLPALRDRNIFCANAFDDTAPWYKEANGRPFDWIVGNPPWKDLRPSALDPADRPAWRWMKTNHETRPVGGNQLAEAFAWRSTEVLARNGAAALLLPAMTLFKYESKEFRKAFLTQYRLWSLANLANLAEVLFGRRARLPAAAAFFSPCNESRRTLPHDAVEVFSPLVANQFGCKGRKAWTIMVNSGELREVEYRAVANGDQLPWKIAMWGSLIDTKVMRGVEKRFRSLGELEAAGEIVISEGMQLRSRETPGTERHDELIGRLTVDVKALKNRRFLLRFPPESLVRIDADRGSVRAGRYDLPARVSRPPHVLVGASRNFAVYSENFLVVPPRQIGVNSPDDDRGLLKAIALYLNSDFVAYHQFLTTTQAGIQKSVNTLRTLRTLPVPFDGSSDLRPWQDLYSEVVRRCVDREDFDIPEVVEKLNDLTSAYLRLSSRARIAVQDLVRVRIGLVQGKTPPAAVAQPTEPQLLSYAQMLRDDLDSFVGKSSRKRHRIEILFGGGSGLIQIDLAGSGEARLPVRVLAATDPEADTLARARLALIRLQPQWLYFHRNLRIYEGTRTYVLKPLQRLQWTQTQAMQDAAELIADSLEPADAAPQ